MPTQITHLVHGQQLLRRRPELDAGAFLRGTIFPDIRYMAHLERSRTHRPNTYTLANVLAEPDAWRAGVMFHNWADDAWTEYMTRYGLQPKNHDHTYKWATLKILQDKHTYAYLENRLELAGMLARSDEEVASYGVTPALAKRWGELISLELRDGWMAPSWDQLAREGLHLDDEQIQSVRDHVAALDHEGVWLPRLEECWRYVSEKVESYG